METQALQKVEQYALKKQNIFASSKIRYVLRSILASMFIGFGITAASKTGSYFFMADSPFAFPAAAVTFGCYSADCLWRRRFIYRQHLLFHLYRATEKTQLAQQPVLVDVKLCRQFNRCHSVCHPDQRDGTF